MLGRLKSARRFIIGAGLSMSGVFLTFITRIFIVRTFGLETLASFAVWQNNVTLASLIATLGQQNLIIRRFSTAKVENKRLALATQITVILCLTISTAFLAWAILWLFYYLTNGPTFAVTIWSLPAVIIWAVMIVVAPMHRSIGSYYAGLTFDRVLPRVFFLLTLIGLALFVGDTVLDISIWFTGALFVCLFITLHLLRTYKIGFNTNSASLVRVAKPWLSQLGPFFFGATISALNARFPILIASFFFLPVELGMVVLMFTFLTLISIPTATLNLVLGPNIRRKIAANPNNSTLRVQYASAAALLAAVSSLIVAVVYPWFVETENQFPISTLMIFAGSLIIAAVSNAIIFFQFQAGSRYILNYIAATVFGIRIVLGLFGLNTLGLYGLGMSEIASNCMLLLLLYAFVVRKPV